MRLFFLLLCGFLLGAWFLEVFPKADHSLNQNQILLPPWRDLVKDMRFVACGELDGASVVIGPRGLDDNPCTLTCPCRSVTRALSQMDVGDTLFLRTGSYNVDKESLLFLPTDKGY
jgi:hypothetical protein